MNIFWEPHATMDATTVPAWIRAEQSLGNSVELGHVNVQVPDQRLATAFYVSALGLTRDPFLNVGVENMWANCGNSQFHLPTRPAQRLRGIIGLVLPDLAALIDRLATARRWLDGTQYAFTETADGIAVTCPWGNRLLCHAPDPARFGRVQLAMPYVRFDVRPGTAPGIARCYRDILGVPAVAEAGVARATVARDQYLLFAETDAPQPAFDGHHVQIAVVDFGAPHARLRERGLITAEDNAHQYRFTDLVDPADGRLLFQVEHEIRSTTHPMFARPMLNRDPDITNRRYAPGREVLAHTLPPD